MFVSRRAMWDVEPQVKQQRAFKQELILVL